MTEDRTLWWDIWKLPDHLNYFRKYRGVLTSLEWRIVLASKNL